MSIPVTALPLFLEKDCVERLENELNEAQVFCSLEETETQNARYFPEATMRIAWDALAKEHAGQKGLNVELRQAIFELRKLGVNFAW